MSSSSSLSGARRRRVGGGSGPTSTSGTAPPSKPPQKVSPGLKASNDNNVVNPFQLIQQHEIKLNILHDIPAAEYIDWSRYEETEDEMGRLKVDKTLWTNKIYIILQPLSEKDRSFLPQGLEVSSYMKAYTEPRYFFNNQRLEIEVGDVFVRSDGHKYMVETIAGKYGNFKAQVYRKLLLRGIDND